MKFRIVTVAAAAAALSLAMTGSATASAAGRATVRQTARPPQVTGSRLKAGLLPPSAFGDSFTLGAALSTGGKLQSTHATKNVPSMSCATFEGQIFFGVYGDTAGALSLFNNPNAAAQFPNGIFYGYEAVIQFASARATATFFAQAQAKFERCQSFSEPNPGDSAPGGGKFQVGSVSVAKTSVSGYQGFVVTQSIAMSETPGTSWYRNILFVVSGTNVYSLWEVSGVNDEPSPAVMTSLIHRIQALYPRRA